MINYRAIVYIKGRTHPKVVSYEQLEEMFRTHELFHRIGGPAIEIIDQDGHEYRHWYKDGLEHREDGPSFETREGNNSRKGFRLEGKFYSLFDWAIKTNKSIDDITIYLFDQRPEIREQAQMYIKYLKGELDEKVSYYKNYQPEDIY